METVHQHLNMWNQQNVQIRQQTFHKYFYMVLIKNDLRHSLKCTRWRGGWKWCFLWLTGPCCSSAPGEDPIPRYWRSPGSFKRACQAVRRPHLCHRVYQHGGHWDTGTSGWKWHPVSTNLVFLTVMIFCMLTTEWIIICVQVESSKPGSSWI